MGRRDFPNVATDLWSLKSPPKLGPPDLRGWNEGANLVFLRTSILVGEPSPKKGKTGTGGGPSCGTGGINQENSGEPKDQYSVRP